MIQHGETRCEDLFFAWLSQKKIKKTAGTKKSFSTKREKSYVSKNSSSHAKHNDWEMKAAWKIHEVEIQTSALFEEQRRGIINQATCELRMQENNAASTVDR